MKKTQVLFWSMLALIYFSSATAFAQLQSKYGSELNPHGTVKILIVFAELEASCADPNPSSNWPSGVAAPPNADKYLDYAVNTTPINKLSKYYRDISLGEFNVIGDYYDGTVQVSCADLTAAGGIENSNYAAIKKLNSVWTASGGNYLTKHGLNLNSFDEYPTLGYGQYKAYGTPDGKIDAVVILWRNHPGKTFINISCGSGLGVGNHMSETLKSKTVDMFGEWEFCPDNYQNPNGYDGFFVTEFMHALFGGNNFHIAGGAGTGTYPFNSGAYSTNQGGVSNIVCGWDRNFLNWKGSRQYPISALNTSSVEVQTDLSTSQQGVSDYILRDFVTAGDAIRIKLPHFNWQTLGDKKNQYLWIENHQLVNEFDHNRGYGACQSWVPGVYCYVQAGKDLISGPDTYGGSYASPNELNDWLYFLPAEGRWDFYYDLALKNQKWYLCQFNNKSIPYGVYYPDGSTKANPFNGFTDTYGVIDSDGGGTIGPGDDYRLFFEKWPGIPYTSDPNASLSSWGDGLDAFSTVGRKIGLGTNPSTAPVYTQAEGASAPSSYDNHSIHLNNLSVEIINTNYYNVASGPKAIHVRIKWNDKDIVNDTRWCGNVILKNDGAMQMGINLLANKKITIDRGLSATQYAQVAPGIFSNPSFLHLMTGTTTTLQNGAQILVKNGSTFHMQTGANLVIGPNASVNIDATSFICIEQGANITFQDPVTSKIIINGVAYGADLNIINAVLSTTPYRAFNSISVSGIFAGTTMPASGSVLLEAGKSIDLLSNTNLLVGSSQSFIAQVKSLSDCSGAPFDVARIVNNNNDDNHSTHSKDLVLVDDNNDYFQTSLNGENQRGSNNKKIINETLLVYPNPAHHKVYWRVKQFAETSAEVNVYNYTGALIYQDKSAAPAGENTINTSEWKSGIYLLQVKNGEHSYTQRLVIE